MGLGKNQYEQIAGLLCSQSSAPDVAFLPDDPNNPKTIYYAMGTASLDGIPRSPIVDVMQGMNERGTEYQSVIRSQQLIYHSGKPSVMDKEMAGMNNFKLSKVNRKKSKLDLEDFGVKFHELHDDRWRWIFSSSLSDFNVLPIGPAPGVPVSNSSTQDYSVAVEKLYMLTLYSLIVARIANGKGETGGNIGAMLVSKTGELLAWGLNTKSENSTYHAEVNCLQSYFFFNDKPIPSGSRLYTTLKPCRMCAGMIKHAGGGSLTAVFGQDDLGPDAKKTVLKDGRDSWLLGGKGVSTGISIDTLFDGLRAMSDLLGQARDKHKNSAIVDALATSDSTSLMQEAASQLLDHMKLDLEPSSYNSMYYKVIQHLKPFVQRRGATLTHLIDLL